MAELEKFAHYLICQATNRAPVSLPRVSEEVVCLGFDPGTESLVEIHIVSDGESFTGNEKLSFFERAWNAAELESPSFSRILDVGESDGMLYYVTEVSDGEFLTDYIQRHGPTEPTLGLALAIELTDSIILLQPHYRLLMGVRLSNLLAIVTEGAYLTLRLIDLGLARRESRRSNEFDLDQPMKEISALLYYILGGRPFLPGQPGQIEGLRRAPDDLKTLLRRTLKPDATDLPDSLESYRRALRQCLSAIEEADRPSGGAKFRSLAIPAKRFPRFAMQRQVFAGLSAPALLAPDYREAGGGASDPYRLLAIRDGRPTEKRVVQLLPPESILPIDLSQRVTELAGKLPAEDTVAPFEVLERKGPRLIVEEAVSGFSLRELLAARGHSITSAEAIGILRELSAGLDAAIAAGLSLPALTTDSVVYEFPGETTEAIEALKTRPISEWPDSRPRLRIHPSMAGLLFPPPGGKLESGRNRRRAVTPGVLMERRFVGLANTLVVGPWPPTPDGAARPDAGEKREALRSYLRETLAAIDDRASTFDRGAFVGELEARLAGSPRREASESTASIAGAATALVGFLGAISPLAWEFFAFTGENRLFF